MMSFGSATTHRLSSGLNHSGDVALALCTLANKQEVARPNYAGEIRDRDFMATGRTPNITEQQFSHIRSTGNPKLLRRAGETGNLFNLHACTSFLYSDCLVILSQPYRNNI